ncbi:hypothetical protein [Oceanicola sp. S124]|uniref:hypothetical protein n=1 Tax=Oceanicola sp. S124 TaxID=1042378 RepID=UPI0002558D74|nr:hypothetical protein [Oceanicola sp. S124]
MNAQAAPRTDHSFTFRPAKLRRPQTWSFKGDRLTGPGGTVALRSVQRASLLQMRSGATRTMRFDLETAGQVARIQIATSARRNEEDPDLAEYLGLLSQVATRLGQVRPGMTYQMEDTGRARLAVFLIGAALLLVGLVLCALAALAFHGQPRNFFTLLPVLLLMMVAGALISCRFWPFRRAEELSPRHPALHPLDHGRPAPRGHARRAYGLGHGRQPALARPCPRGGPGHEGQASAASRLSGPA